MRLLLDTGVLGGICHPRKHADIRDWFDQAVLEHEFLVSVVSDYELRRKLLQIGSSASLRRLDELGRELPFIDLPPATWRDAAAGWAAARKQGIVTAPPEALDGDVLLGAQAAVEAATVVTTNVKHFAALGIPALAWMDVPTPPTAF